MDYNDNSNRKSNQNLGFKYGLIGGFLIAMMFLVMMFLTKFSDRGDIVVVILSLPLFYGLARSAAEAQFNQQRNSMNPLAGVEGAAQGAAMISCVLGWVFIIARLIFQDSLGYLVIMNPLSTFGMMVVSFSLAVAIGRAAGSQVAKKHSNRFDY